MPFPLDSGKANTEYNILFLSVMPISQIVTFHAVHVEKIAFHAGCLDIFVDFWQNVSIFHSLCRRRGYR